MVSLKDVAMKSGVSVTQASRALNGYNDVSEKTKEKVRNAAKELKYAKNINAHILATKNSNQIAVIIYGIDNDKNSEPSIIFNIIKGINRYAKENNYEAVVHLNEDPELSYLSFCRQRGLMGVILFGVNYEDNNFKELMASDFPCVVIDIPVEGVNKGSVVVNNILYSMHATQKLLDRGCRHIAMLTGHGASMVEVERHSGYEMALKKAGINLDISLVVKAAFDSEKAYEQTKNLISKHAEIDGIFCASDFMALGAISAIREMNKKVPSDIAVFGFDGIALGGYTTPPLSTITQDNLRKGYSAARLLCDILNKRNEDARTIVVPCEITLRGSC